MISKDIHLKAVLFDMDGVLFDSMTLHADAWHQATKNHGLNFTRKETFLHEGRTGVGTINIIYQRELGRDATTQEVDAIYEEKSKIFNSYPLAKPMPGAWELLKKIKSAGLLPMVVTGSAQLSLLNRLEENFPDTFNRQHMVTALDVKHGKPHPEPYLMALQKANLKANEAIVIENAPLGIESARAAELFTVAVNTGPLEDKILLDAGANALYPAMQTLCDDWEEFIKRI